MPTPALLKVARTSTGYCVRIEGRGTMRESPAAAEFVLRSLEKAPAPGITVDLSGCDYLDSTFLGCLVEMQRRLTKTPAAPGMNGP